MNERMQSYEIYGEKKQRREEKVLQVKKIKISEWIISQFYYLSYFSSLYMFL